MACICYPALLMPLPVNTVVFTFQHHNNLWNYPELIRSLKGGKWTYKQNKNKEQDLTSKENWLSHLSVSWLMQAFKFSTSQKRQSAKEITVTHEKMSLGLKARLESVAQSQQLISRLGSSPITRQYTHRSFYTHKVLYYTKFKKKVLHHLKDGSRIVYQEQ